MITTALMKQLGWVYPDAWAASFAAACPAYGIDTKDRIAAFLAQVGHESGGGKFIREIWGPTEAQAKYEGRRDLGNVEKGDGLRFRGRGAIQITGRANTTAARDALKPDMALDVFCAWLETAEGAGTSAAWWWNDRKLNELADAGRFDDITRRVNGGFNGRDDRIARWTKAKAALDETPAK
jgi:putative chitinase